MKKLYEKNELTFAIVWIVIYCFLQSLANPINEMIGIEYAASAVFGIAQTAILFALSVDYQSKSVADFNMDLLAWAEENDERMARIAEDVACQDFSVNLSWEELPFVTLTAWLSRVENGKYVQSKYMGQPEEDPSYNQFLPLKTPEENGYGTWCDLSYQFSYHIADKQALTVGERDACIGNMMREIREFWNGTDIEDMLRA